MNGYQLEIKEYAIRTLSEPRIPAIAKITIFFQPGASTFKNEKLGNTQILKQSSLVIKEGKI